MRPPLRSPVAWAAVALVAVTAGGVAADALSPAAPRRHRSVGAITPGGVWACPVASFGGLGGFVSVANGSVERSAVRVRFVRPPLAPQEFGFTLAPGHASTLKVPPGAAGAGAIVQWAGGDVVAARSAAVVTPQGKTVATGASCSRTGETTLAVTGLRTLNGDSRVVLLNPSSAEALVDVSFLVAGDEVTPESLTSRVVPARGRLEVRVGDFVFDKPDIAALVRVTTGTVVADGILISQQGAHIVPAGAPQRAAAAAAETPFGAKLDVVSLGDEPTTAVATTILTRSQETTAGFPAALDPLGPQAIGYEARGPLGVSLSVREGSPFVGSVAWSLKPRGAGDTAAVPLVPAARRWLAVTQSPIGAPAARLVIANPGVAPVRLRARFLTADGQVASGELADVRIPAGRVVAFPIRTVGSAIGVEVVAVDGVVVTAIVVSGGSGEAAFSYALTGVPAQPAATAAIVLDPRTGVPARRER